MLPLDAGREEPFEAARPLKGFDTVEYAEGAALDGCDGFKGDDANPLLAVPDPLRVGILLPWPGCPYCPICGC